MTDKRNPMDWPRNLSDHDLQQEAEDTEHIYLAEVSYMNYVAEDNAGMLPSSFDEIEDSVRRWRERYDKLAEEIVRRIREGGL